LALPREFGKPDLFITMTCNPQWKEITSALAEGQEAYERPDLIARVFHMKMHALLHEVTKNRLFGPCKAHNYVVEFQTRGLPHMHLLIYLEEKITTSERIDTIISAELPNSTYNPILFDIITRHNIHECSRNHCLDEQGQCRKHFPKTISEQTVIRTDGWPDYRRRDTVPVLISRGRKFTDNQYVVNYNPHLSLLFNSHINVEFCAGLPSIKYLYKYMHKGPEDFATAVVTKPDGSQELEHDEPSAFLKTRIVGTSEACWGYFGFELFGMSHSVVRLPVHSEGQQVVFFREGGEVSALHENKNTKLMAFFDLNIRDPFARTLLYDQIPQHYTFRDNQWVRRARRSNKPILSRMHFVSPTDLERFSLRLLLLNVRGPKSFKDLKGRHNSFREAARAMGLLLDDHQWRHCLEDASAFKTARAMRQLFAIIWAHCALTNPYTLWMEFKEHMMEDFVYAKLSVAESETRTLQDIRDQLHGINPRIRMEAFGFEFESHSDSVPQMMSVNDTIRDEYRGVFENNYAKFNPLQKEAFDEILESVTNPTRSKKLFFLDGPGGTGKTYIYNTLINALKSRNKYAVSCAFTGIASSQLIDGMTIHTTYSIPIDYETTAVLQMSPLSKDAQYLKGAAVLIFDEAPMIPSAMVNLLDKLLRDISSDAQNYFGGKVVVFGGDFRQCLPVVKGYDKKKILSQCIRFSDFWKEIHRFKLTMNMRATDAASAYSRWLLDIGNGTYDSLEYLPPGTTVSSETELIDEVFGSDFSSNRSGRLHEKCILAPRNSTVLRMNNLILSRLSGCVKSYYSIDSLRSDNPIDPNLSYPSEFLNSIEPNGFPPHQLHLKVGSIVMLIRNLNVKGGLCNGTRLRIKELRNHCIRAVKITTGEEVSIPRITIMQQIPQFPVPYVRCQFPLKLAFCLTINKAQGQTFEKVGVCLDEPVFAHGQLYVAMSRTRSFEKLRIYNPTGRAISNIVYSDVIR
jgi:hypothetical protein